VTARTLTAAIISFVVAVVCFGDAALAANGPDLRRIVAFHEGVSPAVQEQVVLASGSRVLRVLPLINALAIELPADGRGAALSYLQTHPTVARIHRSGRVRAHGALKVVAQGAGSDGAGSDGAGSDGAGSDQKLYVTPVTLDPGEFYPWGIDRIRASDVHGGKRGVTGVGVTVAVFDTGIDLRHPELKRSIVGGFNAILGKNPNAFGDDNGHGTAMAGIIAARRNGLGVVGAAPAAHLYAVKVLDENGEGDTMDIIAALDHLASLPDMTVPREPTPCASWRGSTAWSPSPTERSRASGWPPRRRRSATAPG
jgi:hypothetical protein